MFNFDFAITYAMYYTKRAFNVYLYTFPGLRFGNWTCGPGSDDASAIFYEEMLQHPRPIVN